MRNASMICKNLFSFSKKKLSYDLIHIFFREQVYYARNYVPRAPYHNISFRVV